MYKLLHPLSLIYLVRFIIFIYYLVFVSSLRPPYMYITDIIEGGPAIFDSGLRQLLEDTEFMKVMHDCRYSSPSSHLPLHVLLLYNIFFPYFKLLFSPPSKYFDSLNAG